MLDQLAQQRRQGPVRQATYLSAPGRPELVGASLSAVLYSGMCHVPKVERERKCVCERKDAGS